MHARSALFDLYGDHLLTRGGQAPVAALVRLLAPLGISAPAVRTAVSRMAGQGWLVPVRLPEGAGYRLTPQGVRRLTQAAERIYRRAPGEPPGSAVPPGAGPATSAGPAWDGRWHVVVLDRVPDRRRRDRLRSALGFLGYACLDGSTWISPRESAEAGSLLGAERARAECFHASYDGDPRDLAARAWDIGGLARAYSRWLDLARGLPGRGNDCRGNDCTDRDCTDRDCTDEALFAARSELVHSWRKFLFIDPGLPAELLPPDWPGAVAAEFFDAEAARLMPAATRFVDQCLAGPSGARSR